MENTKIGSVAAIFLVLTIMINHIALSFPKNILDSNRFRYTLKFNLYKYLSNSFSYFNMQFIRIISRSRYFRCF